MNDVLKQNVTYSWFFSSPQDRKNAKTTTGLTQKLIFKQADKVINKLADSECPKGHVICNCWIPQDKKIPFTVLGLNCFALIETSKTVSHYPG